MGKYHAGLRVAQFLDARGLLVPAPAKAISMDEAAVNRLAATVPTVFRADVDAWIRVLRGQGSRPSRQMSWTTVRRYLGYVLPVLNDWHDQQIHSLRQITAADIQTALSKRPHPSNHSAFGGLRSLFRALKRERLIFRDPARNLSLTRTQRLPRPLPPERVQGLIDRAPTSMSAAAIALIAVHAVRHTELRHLRLGHLDRTAGRLVIYRPGNTRTTPSARAVALDELTLRLLTAWLRERHRQWPHSTNPHLFVSRRTAMNTDSPPINKLCLVMQFRKVGVTPSQLWTDRVLDEAIHTADPVHLMRVFDICQATAIKYVATAHPDRFVIDPTQA